MTSARFGALWLVAAALVAGLVVIGLGDVRRGGLILAGTLVVAALLRLTLPRRLAGALVVRSRAVDVIFLLLIGFGLLSIVLALDLRPRG